MIVNNLHVHRPQGPIRPLKTNPPLVIDADAVLALTVSEQNFKPVAGQNGKVSEHRGGLKTIQLEASGAFDSGEGLDPFSGSEVPGPLVAIAGDHSSSIRLLYALRTAYFVVPELLFRMEVFEDPHFLSYLQKTFFKRTPLRYAPACGSKVGGSFVRYPRA